MSGTLIAIRDARKAVNAMTFLHTGNHLFEAFVGRRWGRPAMFANHTIPFKENQMQVKTNVRAGASKQKQKRGSSTDSSSVETESVDVVAPPPVVYTRCVGI